MINKPAQWSASARGHGDDWCVLSNLFTFVKMRNYTYNNNNNNNNKNGKNACKLNNPSYPPSCHVPHFLPYFCGQAQPGQPVCTTEDNYLNCRLGIPARCLLSATENFSSLNPSISFKNQSVIGKEMLPLLALFFSLVSGKQKPSAR